MHKTSTIFPFDVTVQPLKNMASCAFNEALEQAVIEYTVYYVTLV